MSDELIYKVESPTEFWITVEIADWSVEHFGYVPRVRTRSLPDSLVYVHFKTSEDAIIFALKWF
jgi:hypothetical protein